MRCRTVLKSGVGGAVEVRVLAGLCSFLGPLGESFFCLSPAAGGQLCPVVVLPPSSEPQCDGFSLSVTLDSAFIVTYASWTLPISKDPCHYVGLTSLIEDHLPMVRVPV